MKNLNQTSDKIKTVKLVQLKAKFLITLNLANTTKKHE